jgi:branched-chain amino acid transport system ATP-binding protein
MTMKKPMLKVSNLHAFYGKSHILHGVDFSVEPGEIVTLLGRNGSGRSTLAKSIVGQVSWEGDIHFEERSLKGLKSFELARLGMGYVPESREIFPDLTVEQNLSLGQQFGLKRTPVAHWGFEDMYHMFPRLRERAHVPAGVMSGGEQQMLTLCRTLMGNPSLIIVDEPTEGLAPKIIDLVKENFLLMKRKGLSILLIEQKLTIALDISDRVLVMGHGQIVFEGTPGQLSENQAIRKEWLEV